jgi:hypothetical protein
MIESDVTIDTLSKEYAMWHMYQSISTLVIYIYNLMISSFKFINGYFDDFTKLRIMYVMGAFQLVFTPFILFYNMPIAKIMHIIKFIFLMPLRFRTFKKMKWHYFMLEFCYYAGLLLNLFILQEWFMDGYFDKYFITVYTFATGPLMFAIYLNRDKLFLHSQSHLTSTYIHMTPALMVWGLRWHNTGTDFTEMYPVDFTIMGIMSYYCYMMKLTVPVYMVWAVGYYWYMFIYKWNDIYEKDNQTMYRQFAENDKNDLSKIEKKLKTPYTKGLLYIGIHALSAMITSFMAILMFNSYYLNMIGIITSFLSINWFGSYKMIKAIMMYEESRKIKKKEQEEASARSLKRRRVVSESNLSQMDNNSDDESENEYMDAYGIDTSM